MSIISFLSPLKSRKSGEKDEKLITGASVTMAELPANIVRHGSMDGYWFYAPNKTDKHGNEKKVLELFEEEHIRKKVLTREYRQIREDLIKPGWDVCLCSLAHASALRSRYARRPFCIVYTPAGPIHDVVSRRLISSLLSDLKPYDIIIATSQDHQTALQEQFAGTAKRLGDAIGRKIPFPVRYARLPRGMDIEKFRPRDKKEARRECKLPEDKFIILCVGRMVVSDKMDLVPVLGELKAFKSAYPDAGNDFYLVLRGGQSWTNYDKILTQEIERMNLGQNAVFCHDAPLAPLYAAADVFIAPSDGATENFGLTPVEAMASGTPAVVSDWDGYKDTVIHGETGFRFRTLGIKCDTMISRLWPVQDRTESGLYAAQSTHLDIKEMFTYLLQLYENPGLRQRMAVNARKHAKENFSWPVVIKRFCGICEESMAEARKDKIYPREERQTTETGEASKGPSPPAGTTVTAATRFDITPVGYSFLESDTVLFPGEADNTTFSQAHIRRVLEALDNKSMSFAEILTSCDGFWEEKKVRSLVFELLRQGIIGRGDAT